MRLPLFKTCQLKLSLCRSCLSDYIFFDFMWGFCNIKDTIWHQASWSSDSYSFFFLPLLPLFPIFPFWLLNPTCLTDSIAPSAAWLSFLPHFPSFSFPPLLFLKLTGQKFLNSFLINHCPVLWSTSSSSINDLMDSQSTPSALSIRSLTKRGLDFWDSSRSPPPLPP